MQVLPAGHPPEMGPQKGQPLKGPRSQAPKSAIRLGSSDGFSAQRTKRSLGQAPSGKVLKSPVIHGEPEEAMAGESGCSTDYAQQTSG